MLRKGFAMVAQVLLVEDDPDFVTSLELALGLIDIDIEKAGSSEEAIEMIDSGQYDFKLIFCDIKLPGADGISFLENILPRNKGMIGVVMTGFRDEVLFDRARHAGAKEILLKPFRMAEFMDMAKKYVSV